MTIEISTSDGFDINIWVKTESIEKFKELVFRATNLWPDAPSEIKKFADQLIHGKELQDYDSQNRDQDARHYAHYHRCSCGYTTEVVTNNPESPTYPVMCGNQHIEIGRIAVKDQPGEFIVKTTPCKTLEMFKLTTKD